MEQPHTEAAIRHTDVQQDTGNQTKAGNHTKPGNHKKPGEGGGADKLGGTRAGAQNVEKSSGSKSASKPGD